LYSKLANVSIALQISCKNIHNDYFVYDLINPPYSSQGHSLSSIAVGDQNSEFGQSAFEGESGEDLYWTVRKPGRVLASHMVTSKSTLISLEQPKYE
jgi:hypothetical protein